MTTGSKNNVNMGMSTNINPMISSNIRSQNMNTNTEQYQMNKSLVDKRGNDMNASGGGGRKKIISSKSIEVNQPKGPEEQYIQDLQKTIYYLELEMKLMKDREIDTKNKVGGYGIKS